MATILVAATQMACTEDQDQNILNAEKLVREAAQKGARIVLLQELFENLYFCQEEKAEHFNLASTLEENRAVRHFCAIAKKLNIVLPISFFEKKNNAHYNTTAVIDADGSILGIYRQCHIPDGPGYEEKFYFNPGDTGFKVWQTKYACIGVGICFYGSSFITDNTGQILAQTNRTDEAVILSRFDLELFQNQRTSWGLFRDRRPAQYRILLTASGENKGSASNPE